MKRFEGKSVIVTGGAAGFGEEFSKSFAAEGASVVVADINFEGAEKVAAELPNAIAVKTDVTDDKQNKALAEAAMDTFGKIDIVCANAGLPHIAKPLIQMDVAEFDNQFALNVRSVFLAAKHCAPHMKPGSCIVNTASIVAIRPRPMVVAYAASKGAVVSLTRGLALELAPDIRVNAVLPVSAPTAFDLTVTGGAGMTEEQVQMVIAGIPMGRRATPKDVADAVRFLASDEAAFLTGVCLDVDGGRAI